MSSGDRTRRITRKPPARKPGRRVPQTLAKRYEIVRRVGVGGMADVYLADDKQLGREVAIKILHPQYAGDESFVERFRREAMSAAKLQHPNIVQIYDSGKDGDFNFIVMEYVEGLSLKDHLAEEGPLELADATRIARRGANRTRLRAPHRTRPSGHQAGQHPAVARRQGAGDRLRYRTSRSRQHHDANRDDPRHRVLPLPGAGTRTSARRPLGHLLARHRPVRDVDRSPAVRRRLTCVDRVQARARDAQARRRTYREDIPRPLEAIVLNALAKRPEDRYSSAALMRARPRSVHRRARP